MRMCLPDELLEAFLMFRNSIPKDELVIRASTSHKVATDLPTRPGHVSRRRRYEPPSNRSGHRWLCSLVISSHVSIGWLLNVVPRDVKSLQGDSIQLSVQLEEDSLN